MNFFQHYRDYIRDNPHGYWFKRKVFGWGWTPVRWQGWIVIFLFVALMVLNFQRIDAHSHSASDTIRPFIIQTAILVFLLIAVCYKKGEPPRWQWGWPRSSKK